MKMKTDRKEDSPNDTQTQLYFFLCVCVYTKLTLGTIPWDTILLAFVHSYFLFALILIQSLSFFLKLAMWSRIPGQQSLEISIFYLQHGNYKSGHSAYLILFVCFFGGIVFFEWILRICAHVLTCMMILLFRESIS